MHEPPYYINYSKPRLVIHNVVTSKYFDLAIAAVIGLNVVTMAMEFHLMPRVGGTFGMTRDSRPQLFTLID